MVAKIDDLQERKRQLLNRSESYRQSMDAGFQNVKNATAWVPKTIRIARTAYPVLLLIAPMLGWVFSRKRRFPSPTTPSPVRRGMVASALAGYRFFRKIK